MVMKHKDILTEDDYCSIEMVDKLINLGFPCHTPHTFVGNIEIIQRVSLYEAQKWLRDVKEIHIVVEYINQFSWTYKVYRLDNTTEDYVKNVDDFWTYEDALKTAIYRVINKLS
jgi:hypothetical protein